MATEAPARRQDDLMKIVKFRKQAFKSEKCCSFHTEPLVGGVFFFSHAARRDFSNFLAEREEDNVNGSETE